MQKVFESISEIREKNARVLFNILTLHSVFKIH